MKSGNINIELTKKNSIITLIIHDNGKGFPANFDIDTSSGLGLKLVKILTEQLKGELSLDNDLGARCIIKFES